MKTNLKNMAWMLAATLVMAACSDSLDESDNTGQGPLTGEGYVKVAINMPSVSSTRAGDPTFADGDDNEYAVKSGIIAFFEGTTEIDATFVKAYDLGNLIQNDIATNDQVSTVVSQIIEAPFKKVATNTMYALVILNSGPTGAKLATVDSSTGNLTLENSTTDIQFTSEAATTNLYTEWNLDVANANFPTNGFLMLNAPLYNSTTSTTQTLVPVTVHASKDAADVATADEIYVERIVGKVNVVIKGYATSLKVEDGVYAGDKVIFSETGNTLGWVLNVTNKNTKPLRDVSALSTWIGYTQHQGNFTGTSEVTDDWVRIYWAKDNNYNESTITEADFTIFDSDKQIMPQTWGSYTTTSATNAQYCLENTETSANYKKNNTTSVVIKAKYDIKGDDTYDGSFFIMDKIANTMTEIEFLEAVKANLTDGASLTLAIDNDAKAGYYEGANLKNLISGLDNVSEDELNALGEVRYYQDGECYYSIVPIKHFNEITYTPGETPVDGKHLGRYGVVRNNWYELTINKVTGPGEPTLKPGDGSVDDDEGYIKCTINVLSWAKRSQGVEL